MEQLGRRHNPVSNNMFEYPLEVSREASKQVVPEGRKVQDTGHAPHTPTTEEGMPTLARPRLLKVVTFETGDTLVSRVK